MDAKAIATATVSTRINHIIIYKKNERNNCNLWFLDRNLRGHRREDCLETGLRGPERTGLSANQNLILGTSTWGAGELQDDWYDGLKTLQGADLSGKTIALFGCGDCSTYSDTFVGGIGELYNGIKDSSAKFIGSVETDDYTFDDSEAVIDGKFIGLPLDDINEDDKTDTRIEAWIAAISPSL